MMHRVQVIAFVLACALLGIAQGQANLKTDWEAYASPLVIPEVIDMTKGGHVDMQMGRAEHNWTSDGKFSGITYGYGLRNGSATFPGPTFKVARGVPISVTWYNELGAKHLLDNRVDLTLTKEESGCYPRCGVPAVVHVHGLESAVVDDGLPLSSVYANQSQTAYYRNNQSSSTKLYHDHAAGLSRMNGWAGLLGVYIVDDPDTEQEYNVDVDTDIPLMFADRLVTNDGELRYSEDSCIGLEKSAWVPESYGVVNTVNGVVMPYVEVPPAQTRFRLINYANARNYNFSIPFADKCKLIAKDSGLVAHTEPIPRYLNLFPFERVEMICDFNGDKDGKKYEVTDIPTVEQDQPYDPRLLEVRISEELLTDDMVHREIPDKLVEYKNLSKLFNELGGKNRALMLGENEYSYQCPERSMIVYNTKEINMTDIWNTLACTKGTVEKWHFKNPTDDPHPFHWHIVNAQCGPTEEEIDTNGFKDVAVIPNANATKDNPSGVTQVCYVACTPQEYLVEGSKWGPRDYSFDTSGKYVAHCHIMEHEDNSMMAWFRITDQDDGIPDDDGSVVGGFITSTVIATAMGMSVLGGLAMTASVLVISVDRLNFLASPIPLSIAFALSAGVMVFISLADLFAEGIAFFTATFTVGGNPDPEAYEKGGSADPGVCDTTCIGNAWAATIGSLFVGVLIILAVEYIVHQVIEKKYGAGHDHGNTGLPPAQSPNAKDALRSPAASNGYEDDKVKANNDETGTEEDESLVGQNEAVKNEFKRAGMMTGVAMAIHNFPEGLALFVSSLQGLRTGIVLSIGIILHNLPEGLAVAAPVYYATGSKWESFKWSAIAGIANPIGAAIGWAAISGGLPYWLEAFLYSMVAGMLMTITIQELLPGAYKFDPSGKYFLPAFFTGFLIIALSVMALHYAGSG